MCGATCDYSLQRGPTAFVGTYTTPLRSSSHPLSHPLANPTLSLNRRSLERAEAAAAEMKRSMYGENPQLDIIQLDLASLNSVSDFVSTFNAKYASPCNL